MSPALPALDRARAKAYRRLIPLVFISYVIAFIDRANVASAGSEMVKAPARLRSRGLRVRRRIFFLGYFLLEIPGSIIVERWSARKWISRIMITWGIIAAGTALVTKPWHFYGIRFSAGPWPRPASSRRDRLPGPLVPAADRARPWPASSSPAPSPSSSARNISAA
jgi:ACS family tartrate transporter-like MFS transporter